MAEKTEAEQMSDVITSLVQDMRLVGRIVVDAESHEKGTPQADQINAQYAEMVDAVANMSLEGRRVLIYALGLAP